MAANYVTDKRYINAADAYAKQLRAQSAQQQQAMQKQLATSKAGVASNYDSSAAQLYLNYARQQNALPEQLQAQGINGGASESALVRLGNQYALNQSNNNASRNAAMGQLQTAYDTNIANMQNELNQTIAENAYQAQQQQIQFNENLRQKALEQFQATIERFTSVKSVDKAIKNLDKKDPNYTAMKQLLQLRRAQIKEAKKNGSGGGGGGGGRRSYGGGGGGGSTTTTSGSKYTPTIMYSTPAGPSKPSKTTKKQRAGKAYKGSTKSYTYNIKRGGIW